MSWTVALGLAGAIALTPWASAAADPCGKGKGNAPEHVCGAGPGSATEETVPGSGPGNGTGNGNAYGHAKHDDPPSSGSGTGTGSGSGFSGSGSGGSGRGGTTGAGPSPSPSPTSSATGSKKGHTAGESGASHDVATVVATATVYALERSATAPTVGASEVADVAAAVADEADWDMSGPVLASSLDMSPEVHSTEFFLDAAFSAAESFAFPMVLALLVGLFLLVQGFIDRNDPKLREAAVRRELYDFD